MSTHDLVDGSAEFYREQAIGQARLILEYLQETASPSSDFLDNHVDLMNDYVAAWLRYGPLENT